MSERLFTITAKTRTLHNTPLSVVIRGLEKPEKGAWALEDVESGERLALQPETGWWSSRAILQFVLPVITRGQTRTFRMVQVEAPEDRVTLDAPDAESLRMCLDGQEVTTYHYSPRYARPFMWPLYGPGSVPLTRAWPLLDQDGDQTDHVHHKSMWNAHGDVNGADNWSEQNDHARTLHDAFEERTSGPVFGRFSTKQNWETADGKRIMRSYTDLTLYAIDGNQRILDTVICFRASDGPVRFGDTKEGGILSVRVASSMAGQSGGLIVNAYGGITESECWGRPSPWVDYSGEVSGSVFGIALMDHPENPCYPTRWHVRDYGLFTANPFALHDYLGSDQVDGGKTLEAGEVWRFSYRIVLHRGRADEAGIRDSFLAYAEPPQLVPVEA